MASDADSIVTSESGNDDSSHDSIINDIDALVIDDKKSSTAVQQAKLTQEPLAEENVAVTRRKQDHKILTESKFYKEIHHTLAGELKRCVPGTEIETLQRILMPNPWELSYRCVQLKHELSVLLQLMHPQDIRLFGSTVMGIAFRGSDLDFYIRFHEQNPNTTTILYNVRSLLERSGRFTAFECVRGARIPLLKCVHIPTGFQCDLNFTNTIGVYNSPIMAHILSFDSRIYVLAVIVKYWMKVHNLIGSSCITSYAALWLLIFYLQQLKEPLLPPIDVFQRLIPSFYIGGINLAFNYAMPNLLRNNQRISELLMGFFEFYATFDFEQLFICPLFGRAFPQANYEKLFPIYFTRYRALLTLLPTLSPMQFNKPICIQDPFEITHTIPGKVSTAYYQIFRAALGNAARICRGKLTSNGESTGLLLALFDSSQILPELDIDPQKKEHKPKAPKVTDPKQATVPNGLNVAVMPAPTKAEAVTPTPTMTVPKQATVPKGLNAAVTPAPTGAEAVIPKPTKKKRSRRLKRPKAQQTDVLDANSISNLVHLPMINSKIVSKDVELHKLQSGTRLTAATTEIYSAWAALAIKYFKEVLQQRFNLILELRQDKSVKESTFSKTFNLHGCYGKGMAPMSAAVHLWAATDNYKSVSVVLYNLEDDSESIAFNEFEQEFNGRLRGYLTDRFLKTKDISSDLRKAGYTKHIDKAAKSLFTLPDDSSRVELIQMNATAEEKEYIRLISGDSGTAMTDNAINLLWAKKCIGFVAKVLEKICGFTMNELKAFNKVSDCKLSAGYSICGGYNPFVKRKLGDVNSPDFLADQITKTTLVLQGKGTIGQKLSVPLQALVHICSKDGVNVSVDIYYTRENKESKYVFTFVKERMRAFVLAYFKSAVAKKMHGSTDVDTKSIASNGTAVTTVTTVSSSKRAKAASQAISASVPILRCKLRPMKDIMSIVQQMLDKMLPDQLDGPSDNQISVNRFWALQCIGFILKIFEEIFQFTIELNVTSTDPKVIACQRKDSDYSKVVQLTGVNNVAHSRAKVPVKLPHIYIQNEIDFSKKSKKKLQKPFNATVHIWAKPNRFESVVLDIVTMTGSKELNFLIESRMEDFTYAYCSKYLTDALDALKLKRA